MIPLTSCFFQYYQWNNKEPVKRSKSRLKHKRNSFRCFDRLVHWASCKNLNKLIGPLNLQWCVQFGHNPFPSAKIDRVSWHRPECYIKRQLKSALWRAVLLHKPHWLLSKICTNRVRIISISGSCYRTRMSYVRFSGIWGVRSAKCGKWGVQEIRNDENEKKSSNINNRSEKNFPLFFTFPIPLLSNINTECGKWGVCNMKKKNDLRHVVIQKA